MEQCSPFLDFDPETPYLIHQESRLHDLPVKLSKGIFSGQYDDDTDNKLLGKYRPGWAMSLIYDSYNWYYAVLGRSKTRTPGEYLRIDPTTLKGEVPLENTNESVHVSVRVRLEKGGISTSGQGEWKPPALLRNKWSVHKLDNGTYRWIQKKTGMVLPEAKMSGFELEYRSLVDNGQNSLSLQ